MLSALRVKPVQDPAIQKSEMCASCHTIHLPVLDQPLQDKKGCEDPLEYLDTHDPFRCFPKRYEQTTYPEWVFSEFRTEEWGGVPAGSDPRSCQDCHMPHGEGDASYKSKIAAIEERSNYPETDYRLPAEDIDLPVRDDFARHYLVGLNVFFIKMAQQFPDVLGIPTADQGSGPDVPPLVVTEQAMLDQAATATAKIEARVLGWDSATGTLETAVRVENLVGHKFPSGVSFRRAFIEFSVLDENKEVIWASGRTDKTGVLVDEKKKRIDGELWWKEGCEGQYPTAYQPHFSERMPIERQSQAQIYQELYMDNGGKQRPMLTTSFLSIGEHVKDNRLQPKGFLGRTARFEIASALGDSTPMGDPDADPEKPKMDENFAFAVRAWGNAASDPDYCNSDDCVGSGVDTLRYRVGGLSKKPAWVRARLYYQAIPPYFLQDRFCVSEMAAKGTTTYDTERLYFLAGHLNVEKTEIESWKLEVADTKHVSVEVEMGDAL